jgi:carboxymethylenebutenolidase
MELRRWRDRLGIPINTEPKFFPAREQPAASAVIAVRETFGDAPAVALAHRILKALWQEEKDTGDLATLEDLVGEIELDPEEVLELAADPQWAERRAADSAAALSRGVFGAPSYVIGDEIFWGQDRLDFVERRLAASTRPVGTAPAG